MRFSQLGPLIGLAACLSAATQAQAQGLHRDHTAIADSAGRPILLRGINLGNWLYLEPWMSGNAPFGFDQDEDGKPDQFGTAIRAAVGTEARAAAFTKAWRDNFITAPDIAQIKRLGFNSVRVPLDYRLFYDKSTGQNSDVGFLYLDHLLHWCAASQIYVFLDMHGVPGSKNYRIPGNIFSSPERQDLLAHIWQRIASRYASNSWLGGYDLINEPVVNDARTPILRDVYRKLTAAIRQSDSNHLIIAEGDNFGSWLDSLGERWDENMALSDHNYGSTLPPKPADNGFALPHHKQTADRLDIPLWMGEFGYNSNPWNNAQKTLCEQTGVGWCCWAYKSTGTWSLVKQPLPPGYDRLLAYWRHEPNAPRSSPIQAFGWLMETARLTNAAHCSLNRDVADGLTRPDFASRAIPYAALTIPGTIAAMDYDMGTDGLAYHDTVSENTGGMGAGFTLWNSGAVGRNDGVDIYSHPDGPTQDAIGNIQPGEWLRYSVTCKSGRYTLRLRFGGSGGKLRVLLDGKEITHPIILPATGGWDRFRTLTVPGVRITASGPAVLRLDFDTSGFNLSRIAFEATKR